MAEATTGEATQAAATPAPQAGDPPAPAAAAQEPPAGSADGEGGSTLDAAALSKELEKARKEAAGYRTRLKSFEDRDKTESEKAQERIAELEREVEQERTRGQESRLRLATTTAARRLGFRNPDIAHRLIALSEVEFDGSGQPKNIERLLGDIAKADPYLVNGTTDAGLGPRGKPASDVDMNDRIRRSLGRA